MARFIALRYLSLLLPILSACSDGGSTNTPPENPNVGAGWITIDSTYTYPTEAYLQGSAFISPTWWRCCSGSAEDTGVTVTWTNLTTGTTGPANQYVYYSCFFSTCAPDQHLWNATIPIIAGENRIEMLASDPGGNIGRAYATVYPGPPPPDTIAPSVTDTAPQNGATGVGVNTAITATFSEQMDPATITAASVILTDALGTPVPGTATYAGTTVTYTPNTDLAYSSRYDALITADAKDIAGNPLSADYSWTFTTGDTPDTTAPTVVSVTPTNNDLCADPDGPISATFSEPINTATATDESFIVKTGTGDALIGTVSSNGSVIDFHPSLGLAYDTAYSATITTAVTDLAGNALSSDYTWDFTTRQALIGSWQAITENAAPQSRTGHTAIWSGMTMIVWGGTGIDGKLNTGGRYYPPTDTWAATTTTGAPTARANHTAVWTGSAMIVWGGTDQNGNALNSGARYDPLADTWLPITTTGAPSARHGHTAIWTGSAMIVWGGEDGNGTLLNSGARYNPDTDSWQALTTFAAPTARSRHTAIWTGSEMIVWGGIPITDNQGARYDPASDTWQPLSTVNAPSGRTGHSAVWTGNDMIVWGGYDGTYTQSGGIYHPASDSWQSTPLTCAPAEREGHAAIWSGSRMIVWGGRRFGTDLNAGASYDLLLDTWYAMQFLASPSALYQPTGIWSGSAMIVWGAESLSTNPGTGGLFTP